MNIRRFIVMSALAFFVGGVAARPVRAQQMAAGAQMPDAKQM